MAVGSEIILGWKGAEALLPIAQSLGLTVDFSKNDPFFSAEGALLDKINADLLAQYKPALLALPDLAGCGTGKIVEPASYSNYLGLMSPVGHRAMSHWRLEFFYDPREMGEEPQHAVLGVSLIGRYVPTFLDWREEHGGSGDVFEFTPELMRDIEIARQYIMNVMPVFKDARIIVKEIHY